MNDRLINEFITEAARAPAGKRMEKLIALVAERCATICEIDPTQAPITIRSAFIPFQMPKVKPIALAANEATRH